VTRNQSVPRWAVDSMSAVEMPWAMPTVSLKGHSSEKSLEKHLA
jgi:hypothetical protein